MIASSRVLMSSAARRAPPLPAGCRPAPPPDNRASAIGTTSDFTRGYSNRKTRQQVRQAGKEHGEAREVFAARQVLEAGTVAAFIGSATRADCKRLHEHVAREQAAWRQGDRRASLKFSGEFHLIIAEIAGNQILADMLRDLVSRSSLIIAVYQAPGARCCPPDEHRELALALERRESRAVALMVRHLDQVRGDLRLEEGLEKSIDLRSVFSNGRRAL